MSRVFDPSANWIPAPLKKPVKEAIEAGWTPGKDRIKAGGWFIYSPKKTEKFYIPITCKDPDSVAKKLRSLVNKAYTHESSAFEPDPPPGVADHLSELADAAILKGAVIIPGPTPHIRCPICDREFDGWEAFAGHQEECAAAHPVAVQQPEVPTEGDASQRPSEEQGQSATDSTEPSQSGTISTKEETSMASESTTPGSKRPSEPTHDPQTGRKRGYSWTPVKGKENPLHEVLYEACRYTRRFKNETDSKYSLRLAQYIETEGLLNRLAFDVDAEAGATLLLDRVRELLGIEEAKPDEDAIEQYKKDIEEKNAEIESLTKTVRNLREVFSTVSELGKEVEK